MKDVFLNSLLFIFLTIFFSVLIGLILGVVRASDKISRNNPTGKFLSNLTEMIFMLFEIVPAIGLILVVAFLTVDLNNEFLKITVLSFSAGMIWSCNIGRVVANRLDFEFSKEYSSQLSLLGLSNVIDISFFLIILNNIKEILSSAITVTVYAIVADTSIGFMLNFNPELREAPIRYYSSSYGHYLSTLFNNPKMLTINISGLVVVIAILIILTDWIERKGTKTDNKIVYKNINDKDDVSILRIKELFVKLGGNIGKGFNLILNKEADFNVFPGDVVWLKGVSGSGKSLMFKSMVDYLPAGAKAGGEIEMTPMMSDKKEIEIIFQEPSLYLYPYLRLNALSKLATGKKWRELIGNDFGEDIAKLENSYIESMSAGQKRVAFSNIVFDRLDKKIQDSGNGGLVLCDEPDASLDTKNKNILTEKLSEIAGSNKFGIIYVSHDPSVIASISSKVSREIKVFECKAFDGGSTIVKSSIENVQADHLLKEEKQDFPQWPLKYLEILKVQDMVVSLSADKSTHFRYCNGENALSLPAGQVVVLHGRNGSGKSTFLKGLSGFYASSAKQMTVNSKDVTNMSLASKGRYISHFSDDTEKIFPLYVPIRKYLNKILKINGFSGDQFLEKAKKFDLPDDIFDRYSMELSGGQRQKLVYIIARYVVKSPVVLLDEPFSRLDGESESFMIDDLFGDNQKTYFIISHRVEKLINKGALGLDIDTLLG